MAITIDRAPWTALVDDTGQNLDGSIWNKAAIKGVLLDPIDASLAKAAQLAGGNTFTGIQTVNVSLTIGGTDAAASVGAKLLVGFDGVTNIGLGMKQSNPANTGNYLLFFNSAGAATGNIAQSSATTIVYGNTSDARLKDDDGPATDLAALRAVRVHDFRWKADGLRDRGVFAQDVAALFPRAVLAGTDEQTADGGLARPWMTDYSKFVADLIVGWQHHDAAIAALRAALDALARPA